MDIPGQYSGIKITKSKKNSSVELDKSHKMHRIIGAFYQLIKEVEAHASISPAERDNKQREALDNWIRSITPAGNSVSQRKLAGINLPTINIQEVVMPKLSPLTEKGESYLEPFHRITALMTLLSIHTGTSRWKYFLKHDEPFISSKIEDTSLPMWMKAVKRVRDEVVAELEDHLRKGALGKSEWVIDLEWDHDYNEEDATEFLTLPRIQTEQKARFDPRRVKSEELRDYIKAQYELLKLPGKKSMRKRFTVSEL